MFHTRLSCYPVCHILRKIFFLINIINILDNLLHAIICSNNNDGGRQRPCFFLGTKTQIVPRRPHFWRFPYHTQPHAHPVGLLWTSDQPVARGRYLHTTQKMIACSISGLRNPDCSNRAATHLLRRPHDHRIRKRPQFAAQNTYKHAKGVHGKLSTFRSHDLKKLHQARSVMLLL